MSTHEDKANVLGSQPASAMMLRHFEYGYQNFLLWESAVAAWEKDGKQYNVYEVYQDGSFDIIRRRKEQPR